MKLVGTFYTVGDVYGVAIEGDIAFIADRVNGLETINVSDPAHPTFIGVYPGLDARDVVVSNSIAFIAAGDQGLKIIDISNPVIPILLGSYDTPGSARGVAVVGNTVFVADLDSLQLINISDPANPTLLSSIGYDNGLLGGIYNVTIQSNTAFLATTTGGVQLFDITDLSAPIYLSNYDTSGSTNEITIKNNTAFIANESGGFQLIDISDLSNPQLIGTSGVYSEASAIVEDTAIVVGGNSLNILDISDPTHPTFIDEIETSGRAYDIALSDNYAYVANGTEGLAIITTSKPSELNISAADAFKYEGNNDSTPFTFTVTRSGVIDNACSVNYIASGIDIYSGGTINFSADETSKTITVNIPGNTIVEPNRTFDVTLTYAAHAILGTTIKATGTILDDDIVPVNTPPTGTVIINDTTPKQNQTLSVSNTLADNDGLGIITFTWLADGLNIGTGNNYIVTANEVGKTISVTASYADGLGNIENVSSESTSTVTPAKLILNGTTSNDSLIGGIESDIINGDLGADTLIGGSGNDTLMGNKGNDVLTGGKGRDILKGGESNDTLIGGAGSDTLLGGLGADKFKFNSVADTGITGNTRDIISDFKHDQGDKIDLSTIDANWSVNGNNAFTLLTVGDVFSGSFAHKAELYFDKINHVLYGNTDTDSSAEFSILLLGTTVLNKTDFVL